MPYYPAPLYSYLLASMGRKEKNNISIVQFQLLERQSSCTVTMHNELLLIKELVVSADMGL